MKVCCQDSAAFGQAGEAARSDESNALEFVVDALVRGVSLRQINRIPDEQMDGLYAMAHALYRQGQLDEAEKLFRLLCVFDFQNADFLMGLAAVYQLKRVFGKAIDMYALAFAQLDEDYRPVLYTGQCHLAMGRTGWARRCFKVVITYCRDEALLAAARKGLETARRSRRQRKRKG